MRNLTLLFFILTSGTTFSQRFQNFTVDKTLDYKIKDEGKPFEVGGENFTTKSDVQIDYHNDYNLLTMPQARLKVKGDTLLITLEAINAAIYTKCTITIIGKKFSTSLHFTESGETGGPKEMTTDNHKLVLSHNNFKKGQTVRGHIEFRERCLTGYCPDYIKDSKVKGNFVVTIE